MSPSARPPRARALLETLEPRLLYSADLAAVAGAVGGDAAPSHEVRLQGASDLASMAAVTATASTAAREIAFVDLGVPDAEALVSGLLAQRAAGRPIEVVGFAADDDGLAVISRTLAERQAQGDPVSAVHVFGHGRAGEVRLGAVVLDADSLLRRAAEVAAWGGALDGQADLLLYGCDVAADAGGLFLIEGLAALTGADVAASDDLTGCADRGGDWVLERHTGTIEAAVAASVAVQQGWEGVLGTESQVNTTTSSQQTTDAETRGSQQAVAMDAAGNCLVVWTSASQDGDGQGVYARRFAFDGTALSDEIQVNVTTAKDQHGARIAMDASGGFVVVWSSAQQDGTESSVYLRRFSASGKALTDEIRANEAQEGAQSNAVVGLNTANGDVVVAWQGDGPGAGNVFFRRFSVDGTALDAADRPVATTGTLGGEQDPVVAMSTDGRFVIAWARGDHLYCQRFDDTGAAAGSQIQVDTNLGIGSQASVAMDASGNFLLAYRKDGLGGLSGIWSHAFSASGSPANIGPQFVDSGDATSPAISRAADGGALVVYQKTGDGDGLGVYARKISASGAVSFTAAPFLVNQFTQGTQAAASVSVHDTGHFVVAWSGRGAGDGQGVLVRTFETANVAPQITSNGGGGTATVAVAENTAAVTTVRATDTDWPAQAVTYAITGGADQGRFSIDAQTGALSFLVEPDFEWPTDLGSDNVYDVTVQASDGLLSTTQALAVAITDVNDQVAAVPDAVSTPYATAVTVAVRDNDRLGLGTSLTLLDLVQPAHGTVALEGGAVRYTPVSGFSGTDTFSYRVIDGSEGLTHYWALDDTDAADAITGATSAAVGGPSAVAGVRGQALQFDGLDDHVALADVAYTNEFTLSCWFKLADNQGTGYRYLYSHGDPMALNSLNVYFIEDATNTTSGINNVLRTVLNDGNDSTTLASRAWLDIDATGLADGQWHQYTLTTLTGTGSAVYIDGVQRASSGQGGDAINPTGAVFLGSINPVSGPRYLSGALDDLQLLDHTVTARQAAAMSTGPGATTTVTVTVDPDTLAGVVGVQPPVIGSSGGGDTAALTVTENGLIVASVQATDPNVPALALSYSIIGGADQARFAIDSVSGALSFVMAPDFEHPTAAGGGNVYAVTVQASNGSTVDIQAILVTVTDVDEHDVDAITDLHAAAETVREDASVGTLVGLIVNAIDSDGTHNTVTYALTDSAGGRFALDAASGVVTVAGALDAEMALNHTITVEATSADGSVSSRAFTIAVQDVNEWAVGVLEDIDPASEVIREDAPVGTRVGVQMLAIDADITNHTVMYSLVSSLGGRFAINASTGVITVAAALDAEAASLHRVSVQALSIDGSLREGWADLLVQDVDEFAVTVPVDADAAPDAVAGDAAVGTVVGITGSAVDADATLNQVTYTLADDGDGRFAVQAASGVVTLARSVAADGGSVQTFVLQAMSADGSTRTQGFSVSVTSVNLSAPVIGSDGGGATAAVTVSENVAEVTTVAATDADVPPAVLTYTLAGGADVALFTIDATSGVLRFVTPPDAESPRDAGGDNGYEVTVQVSDGLWSDTQVLTVAVADVNEAPVGALLDANPAADAVSENAAIGTAVGVQALATDVDASDHQVTYTLEDTAGGRFAVDATTGVVTLARPVREEGVTRRTIVLRATSADGSTAVAGFDIAIALVNDAAPVIGSDGGGETAVVAVTEGQTVVTQVSARDADLPTPTLRYTLAGGADAAAFVLDAASGVLRFAVAPDAEAPADADADNVYEVIVQASDGERTDTQALRVTVQPINDLAPRITSDGGGDTALRHVAENTTWVTQVQARDADLPAGTLVYALSGGADAALFTIDGTTGELHWRVAPDRERPLDADADQHHEVIVSASDGLHTTSQALTVVVDDVDEAPVLAGNTLVVSEGGAARPVLTAHDGDTAATRLVYTVQEVSGGQFESVAGPGTAVMQFTQAQVDAGLIQFIADGGEGAPAYRLVLADDAWALAPQAATVTFTPVNDAPVGAAVDLGVEEEDTSRLITAQALLAGTTDADGDVLSVTGLRLAGGEGVLVALGDGRWRFDPATDWNGAVTLAGEVGDGQASVALSASLQVRPVNDAPRLVNADGTTAAASAVLDLAEGTAAVETVRGADIDLDSRVSLRYAVVGGADAARFRIDAATGALSFAEAPDHERPADADGDNRYEVVVEVSDGELRARQALAVAVVNVDEAPVILHNTLVISDGAVTLRLQASDPDTPTTALTYLVDAVEGGQFEDRAAPGAAVARFTQADIDAGRVVWVAPAGSVRGAYALRLNDGRSEIGVGAPVLEQRAVGVVPADVSLQVTTVAQDRGAAATSTPVLPSALTGPRAEPMPAIPVPDIEAGLGLGQGVVAEPGQIRGVAAQPGNGGAVVQVPTVRVAMAPAVEAAEVVLDLLSEHADAPKWLRTDLDLWVSGSGSSLVEQMNRLRQEVVEAQQVDGVSMASTALLSTGVSVGYVIWLVRGGVLMTSLMSAVPAWAGMDPLPVLAEMRRAHGGGSPAADDDARADAEMDDSDDPIEKLFSKARRLLT